MSDPIQPVRHHFSRQNGRCLADKDEESGLKSVFGVVVSEKAAAHLPNHRTMPLDEGGEGCLVSLLDEAAEELPIGQPRPVWQQSGSAKVLDDLAHGACRHQTRVLHIPWLNFNYGRRKTG